MFCPNCVTTLAKKFGKDRTGTQRYRCPSCKKTFLEQKDKPLGKVRTKIEKAVLALRMLLEGNSVRSTARLTGMTKRTVLRFMVRAGRNCEQFLEAAIRNVNCQDVECDELWSYVYCKEKTRQARHYNQTVGDCYVFTAVERHTKLFLTYHVGKRDAVSTTSFVRKLRQATSGNFQISTDGWSAYTLSIPMVFGWKQDFAQVIKIFSSVKVEGEARYSPPEIADIRKNVISGYPDLKEAGTSIVERSNKTIRMGIRRFTRLTDGHSKLWENHEAAIALFVSFYNFCKVHTTLRTTPAVAAGLTDHVWSVQELLLKAHGASDT